MSEQVEYDQPSAAPVPKIQAVGLAGGLVTLILLVASLVGIELEPDQVEEAVVGVSALVSLITFLAGYLKRDAKPPEAVEVIKEQ